jgi:hypothetical protein
VACHGTCVAQSQEHERRDLWGHSRTHSVRLRSDEGVDATGVNRQGEPQAYPETSLNDDIGSRILHDDKDLCGLHTDLGPADLFQPFPTPQKPPKTGRINLFFGSCRFKLPTVI